MKCATLSLDGVIAIVCGSRRIMKCSCGEIATRLCDWKMPEGSRPDTCSSPVCDGCTTQPTPGKDLCKNHGALWKTHPSNRSREPGEDDEPIQDETTAAGGTPCPGTNIS